MSNTYNHLLFLTEKNIDDLMYGKDASIQGFYTKLPTKSENTDFTEVKENIAWYNVRFENKEKVVKNKKNICISISEKNQDLFDFLYDSLEEETYKINIHLKLKMMKINILLWSQQLNILTKVKCLFNSF